VLFKNKNVRKKMFGTMLFPMTDHEASEINKYIYLSFSFTIF